MLRGKQVGLRPVERADLPILEAWTNDVNAHGTYNTFGLNRTNSWEANFATQGLLSDQHGTLMIVTLAGAVIGTMSYHQVSYGPNSGSRAYNIGLSITEDQRGNGYGTEAQRLLADYLLETYPIVRIEASTDITNLPEQRSLEKAGFTREGVLRKAQWRAGAWHDLVVYSRVRGD